MKNTITLLCACENYRIAKLRLTQAQIANKIGVSQEAYCKFASGKMNSSKILKWFLNQPEFVKLLFNSLEE